MKKLHLFQLRRSQIAANIDETTRDLAMASNATALSGEEWEQLTPFGDFPNEKGLQRVTPEIGNRLVAAFNSFAAKAKNLFRGVPIFVGHPDVKPDIYTDHRRYGKLEAVRVGTSGIEGKIAWNDLGEQNQKQGYYVYPSIVWYFKNVGGGVIEPMEIASIGLTNTPNIPGVKPWTKNDRDAAANAGTREGALKGWETRRAGGVSGDKNPRAEKAKAVMAKKAGRTPRKPAAKTAAQPEKKVAAKPVAPATGKAILKSSSLGMHNDDEKHEMAAVQSGGLERDDKSGKQVWRKGSPGSRGYDSAGGGYHVAASGATQRSGAYEIKKSPQTGKYLLFHKSNQIGLARTKADLYQAAHDHEAAAKTSATSKPLPDSQLAARKAATQAGADHQTNKESGNLAKRSSSSGGGNHVHIHFGGAAVDHDPYFGAHNSKPFSRLRRHRVAMNAAGKNKPAAV